MRRSWNLSRWRASEMNWTVLFCLVLMKITSLHARTTFFKKQLREYSEEGNHLPEDGIIEIPTEPEDLPEAEPIAPGHTLLQPSVDMLESAIKFPQKEEDRLVYGNLDNLGIAYGKTSARVLYTGFRRYTGNNVLNMILQAVRDENKRKPILVYIRRKRNDIQHLESKYGGKVSEDENNASEVLDDEELFEQANVNNIQDFRRNRKDPTHKYRERESSESTEMPSSSTSDSSDYERNPGNPYSVFKDKYVQNWMWNHFMDGDHMNVNPYAPQFGNAGPSGTALFFNRKWWYYNQDDFRPFD